MHNTYYHFWRLIFIFFIFLGKFPVKYGLITIKKMNFFCRILLLGNLDNSKFKCVCYDLEILD